MLQKQYPRPYIRILLPDIGHTGKPAIRKFDFFTMVRFPYSEQSRDEISGVRKGGNFLSVHQFVYRSVSLSISLYVMLSLVLSGLKKKERASTAIQVRASTEQLL